MSKFSDKFLNLLRLNDDYDDEYDEYEDEYEEEVPKSESKRKEAVHSDTKASTSNISKAKPVNKVSGKVVPMRSNKMGMEVCVIKPSSVEDSREITDTLLSGRAVVLNLEGLHVEIAQRIIDFTSGSCYAINGNLQKISNYIFIITPETVDISGDFQDLLAGGNFDVASFKSPL